MYKSSARISLHLLPGFEFLKIKSVLYDTDNTPKNVTGRRGGDFYICTFRENRLELSQRSDKQTYNVLGFNSKQLFIFRYIFKFLFLWTSSVKSRYTSRILIYPIRETYWKMLTLNPAIASKYQIIKIF